MLLEWFFLLFTICNPKHIRCPSMKLEDNEKYPIMAPANRKGGQKPLRIDTLDVDMESGSRHPSLYYVSRQRQNRIAPKDLFGKVLTWIHTVRNRFEEVLVLEIGSNR